MELMDAQRASEVPRSELRAPTPMECEIRCKTSPVGVPQSRTLPGCRVVIWGARSLKLVDGDHVDGMVVCSLDCQASYKGESDAPARQKTDVHYNSTTGACVFNWRVCYPRVALQGLESCVLQLAAYDYNNLAEPTFIGEVRRLLEGLT